MKTVSEEEHSVTIEPLSARKSEAFVKKRIQKRSALQISRHVFFLTARVIRFTTCVGGIDRSYKKNNLFWVQISLDHCQNGFLFELN